MTPPDDLARLRAGFAARPATAAAHVCPEPGRIWDAAHGQLTAAERRDLVAAVASCGQCAEAWRLAAELAPASAVRATIAAPVAPGWRRWGLPAMAAAAIILAVVIIGRGGGGPVREPGFRGGEPGAVEALIADGATLPRDAFELRWSEAAPGSRYDLSLFTAELVPLYTGPDLATATFRVPAAALDGQPAGAALYWRVDVRTPDGRRATSATYRVIVR